ncbi:AMP-dependent synthetase/ligase [Thiohalocapsa marina]|uniref:AMP-dependent synthetase/ligase n=1 Tax=Thiohalocapsa marina TaxID=424902 RepID=UPI0036D9B9F3
MHTTRKQPGERASTGSHAEAPVIGANVIGATTAGTLPGLLHQRVARTPQQIAYRAFHRGAWRDYSWQEIAERVARWRHALAAEGLRPGERVALCLPNGVDWVCFDQAAQGLGLVTVPLYSTDSPGNLRHILTDSGASLVLFDRDAQWQAVAALDEASADTAPEAPPKNQSDTLSDPPPNRQPLPQLRRILYRNRCKNGGRQVLAGDNDDRMRRLDDWLPQGAATPNQPVVDDPDALATLIYTSGTTGPPKGVMLSHRNILSNAEAVLQRIPALPSDEFLSFLPLAHAFERTVGYYLPMMAGCRVSYARSIADLRDDLLDLRPTVMLSVPRIYDKIYLALQARLGASGLKRRLFDRTVALGWQHFEAEQGRAAPLGRADRMLWALLRPLVARPVLRRLGGRLRVAVSGGAPLSPTVARLFIGLGLPLTEGYGLTEAAPVVSATEPADCIPGLVGRPLPGVEIRIAAENELLVRSAGVMQGYWGQPQATAEAIDTDGWLHTGDQVALRDGYVQVRGRLKEILVTSTGEKVPPTDMELALTMDPLFEQAMVVGEGRPFLSALLVLSDSHWRTLAAQLSAQLEPQQEIDADDPDALQHPAVINAVRTRVDHCLRHFPGYAQVRALHLERTPWSTENGLLTPTLKLKRAELETHYAAVIEALYQRPGHARRQTGEQAGEQAESDPSGSPY